MVSMAMMNMEGEGISDVREYYRKKLVSLGVTKPTDDDVKEAQAEQEQQEPDANDVLLQSAAKKEAALADKAVADTGKSVEEAKKIEAQTVEILAGIDRDDVQQAINLAAELDGEDQRQPVLQQPQPNGNPSGLIG